MDPDRPKGQRFLGVCVVRADGLIEAMEKTHWLGINPGGEIVGQEIEQMPDDCINRLLGQDELLSRQLGHKRQA